MGIAWCQKKLVFCHVPQHQSKMCMLELTCLGKKFTAFCLQIHAVTSWCIIHSKLIACCGIGWVIIASIPLLLLSIASQKGGALSSHDLN